LNNDQTPLVHNNVQPADHIRSMVGCLLAATPKTEKKTDV